MERKILNLLQLFADGGGEGGGDGAGAAAEGGSVSKSDSDGRARLMELGVPESMLRPGVDYSKAAPAKAAPKEPTPAQENAQGDKRPSFQELLRDNPDYNKAAQEMMRKRVGKSSQAERTVALIEPVLQKYREDNHLDSGLDALATITHMSGGYAEQALESGESEETVMQRDIKARQDQEEQFQQHFAGLQQQAAEFQRIVPGFDLAQAMEDEKFMFWTGPQVGMTVEQAFRALHGDEMNAALMNATARKTGDMITNAIASGSRRPVENGANAQSPANIQPKSYKYMTPEERIAFKKARGLPV